MIGHDESGQEVSIDASKLIGTHLAVIGNTGSGKTHTVRKVLEQTWGHGIQIIFDPEQEFHTLRAIHPYVILGGPHQDAQRSAPWELARWVLKTKTSVIIQFRETEHLDQQRDYIAKFLKALMTVPRELWQPVFVVIDEAHRYAPQSGPAGACRREICTLMSQGRKRGFTGILCTQRLAKITKDATGECNTWLVGRVGQVLDRNSAANNLGFPQKSPEALGLRDLDPGQFWGFGVALTKAPKLMKIAATESQHLKLGESFTPVPLPKMSLIPGGSHPIARLAAGIALSAFIVGLPLFVHWLS